MPGDDSTVRFAADENLNGHLFRAIVRTLIDVDIVRVQDTELSGATDEVVLDWMANRQRVLLTHDGRTLPDAAWRRVANGQRMTGVIVVPDDVPVGDVLSDLAVILSVSTVDDWINRVVYLPL
jgi:hypothetical protein